ncbi:sensor histidine kinase [Leuconostoc holzapfelii]|uniref:Sensor histidine kinase n=1 Tax=Leuconostoc holzapfelii TaxID=434464 RepID=A0A846ZI26_9LACO|nr:sensor histidine kinase [Leuconostoc holzapfelii]NKZ19130.1 sensor histidine kinase [Leuconostoc holzapfelii]
MKQNMYKIYVPTMVEDSNEKAFTTLSNFDKQVNATLNRLDSTESMLPVVFSFEKCKGLSTYAIAYMAIISNYIKTRGRKLFYSWATATDEVKKDFELSGFISRYFKKFVETSPYIQDEEHNEIQFRDFIGSELDDIIDDVFEYLEKQWFENMQFKFDESLYSEMVGSFVEMFANAIEHSGNGRDVGIAAYGKLNNNASEIYLCIVDRGVGIVNNVKKYWDKHHAEDDTLDDIQAMRWALKVNNTTREKRLGGQGFSNIRQFIRANQGSLDIYSNSVHARMESDLPDNITLANESFPGTMLIFKLKNARILYKRKA